MNGWIQTDPSKPIGFQPVNTFALRFKYDNMILLEMSDINNTNTGVINIKR